MKNLFAALAIATYSVSSFAQSIKCVALEIRPDGTTYGARVETQLNYAGWGHGSLYAAQTATLKYRAIQKNKTRVFLEIETLDGLIMVSRDLVDLTLPAQEDPQLQIDIKDLRAQLTCTLQN